MKSHFAFKLHLRANVKYATKEGKLTSKMASLARFYLFSYKKKYFCLDFNESFMSFIIFENFVNLVFHSEGF